MRRRFIAVGIAAVMLGLCLPNKMIDTLGRVVPISKVYTVSKADDDDEDYWYYMEAPEFEEVRHLSDRTMLTLVWKNVDVATGYQIQYTQNGKYTKSRTIDTDTNRSATIRGLKEGKDCKIRIRAVNDEYDIKNYSDWTEIKVRTTRR